MARFIRPEVVLKMKETGIVSVFYHHDVEVSKHVLKACYVGVIKVFEFTSRGNFAHGILRIFNKFAAKDCPELILGIGSMIDADTTSLYLQMGANFSVSPILDEEIAHVCNKRKVAWSSGCRSVTEILKAHELGEEVIKIFPGSQVGGPASMNGFKGLLPYTSIMPTGGVSHTADNLKGWFEGGVHCVGMGSQLFPEETIAKEKFDAITKKCAETIDLIKELKS